MAIIAVAIGLYIWGIRVEAENERQLREQTQQFIDSLNNPQGAGDLLAGDAMLIDSLLPQLPALLEAAQNRGGSFTIQEMEDKDTGTTHKLTILFDKAPQLELHVAHPGPTSRLDLTGFKLLNP